MIHPASMMYLKQVLRKTMPNKNVAKSLFKGPYLGIRAVIG